MTITGAALLADIGITLQDPSETIWTDAIKTKFVNEAILLTANLRPDAVSEIVDFPIVAASAKQTIPSDGFLFLEVVKNVGGTNRPITRLDKTQMDNTLPAWPVPGEGVSGVEIVMFDSRMPKNFYIYPVPAEGTSLTIELVYAKTPTAFSSTDINLPLADTWLAPIKEYVLYRCFGTNSKRIDLSRATAHLSAFYNALNIKAQNDTILAQLQDAQEG